MSVDDEGAIHFSDHPPLQGQLRISPILTAEESSVEQVLLLLNSGRYYIAAEGFRHLWEVTPRAGTHQALFRPIRVSEHPLREVRIARYGSRERACVRIDAASGGPWYVNPEGELDDHCR